jgi:hypothetical protein
VWKSGSLEVLVEFYCFSKDGQRPTVNGHPSTKKPLGVAENPFPELPFFTK